MDKARRERDEVRKQKELSDLRMLALEQNLNDLTALVDRC